MCLGVSISSENNHYGAILCARFYLEWQKDCCCRVKHTRRYQILDAVTNWWWNSWSRNCFKIPTKTSEILRGTSYSFASLLFVVYRIPVRFKYSKKHKTTSDGCETSVGFQSVFLRVKSRLYARWSRFRVMYKTLAARHSISTGGARSGEHLNL